VNGRTTPRHQAALGLDPARPTVIFAPTFSQASALNHAGEAIIEALIAGGGNVIAKLHDRALDPDPRYTGGVNWRERLDRYAGPHFLLAASGDSTPFVLASDLMVTDHSSIGFEFCAADRPLVVFDAPGLIEAARINQEKVSLLRSAADVVTTPAQLAGAVRDALASPRHRAAERRQAASAVFFDPGTATDRALRLVYGLLALPVTATAHAATSAGAVRAA
jgi:CDP-glycerol glycerophosphotransferase (TagB/SpsB family)